MSRTKTHIRPTPVIMCSPLTRSETGATWHIRRPSRAQGPSSPRERGNRLRQGVAGHIVVLPGEDVVARPRDRGRGLGGCLAQERGAFRASEDKSGYGDATVPACGDRVVTHHGGVVGQRGRQALTQLPERRLPHSGD